MTGLSTMVFDKDDNLASWLKRHPMSAGRSESRLSGGTVGRRHLVLKGLSYNSVTIGPQHGSFAGAGYLLGLIHRTPPLRPQLDASVRALATTATSILAALDGARNGARKVADALGKPLSDWMQTIYGDDAEKCDPGMH